MHTNEKTKNGTKNIRWSHEESFQKKNCAWIGHLNTVLDKGAGMQTNQSLTLYLPWVTKTEVLLTIYQYNINQTSDKNKEKYQLGDYKLFQYQILQTNITRTVWQTVRRITDEIFGDLWAGEKGCWSSELTEYFHDTCLLGSCEIFEHLPEVKALSGLTPTKIMYKQVSSRQNNFFNWPLSFEEICLHHPSVTSPLRGGWVREESRCSHMTNI